MQFVTGSPSLSPRVIKVNDGPVDPHSFPLGHTCFNGIDLPHYTTMEELAAGMAEAIVSTDFGLD